MKVVFLDRDGVLNYLVDHNGVKTAPWSVKEFRFIPGARDAVRILKKAGFTVVVTTNQPDLYDHALPLKDFILMQRMVFSWLNVDEIHVGLQRGSYVYKPNNGSIEIFNKQHGLDRKNSWLVGDRWKDIVAGSRSKLNTVFIGKNYLTPVEHIDIIPNVIADDVLDAARKIVRIYGDKTIC